VTLEGVVGPSKI